MTLRGPSAARRGAALHDLSIIEDGSVLIRDGLIDNVGPTRRIENLKEARDAAELDVHGLVVMPGFADPGLRLNLLGSANTSGKPAKPRRITSFSSESAELLHSCLVHGTLNVQVKANAGVGGFRSDVSVLRQLAELGNKPVGMVRAWRIDALAEPAPDSALDYAASLQFLARRNLAHAVEIAVAADNGLSDRVWAAAGEKSLAVNLLWPGGSAELLSNLLQRASPASVYSSSNLSAAECQLLAESSALTVFSP
ncbi:MAG: hypothetical protein JO300_03730, partial [Silvibacterium sp.]|nr:hypothetical protein [Silvibacterium sp.]